MSVFCGGKSDSQWKVFNNSGTRLLVVLFWKVSFGFSLQEWYNLNEQQNQNQTNLLPVVFLPLSEGIHPRCSLWVCACAFSFPVYLLLRGPMCSLPSLTKSPRAVLAGGRSGIPAGAEVCDASPSAKGKYRTGNILEEKKPSELPNAWPGWPSFSSWGAMGCRFFSVTHTFDLPVLFHHPFPNRRENHEGQQATLPPGCTCKALPSHLPPEVTSQVSGGSLCLFLSPSQLRQYNEPEICCTCFFHDFMKN